MNVRMHDYMKRWMDGRVHACMHDYMNGWIDPWMHVMHACMYDNTNRWSDAWSAWMDCCMHVCMDARANGMDGKIIQGLINEFWALSLDSHYWTANSITWSRSYKISLKI